LQDHGVAVKDFNSYGSRRGNHEVMVRGTFANVRLKNSSPRHRGRLHPPPARRQGDVDLRGVGAVPGGRCAAGDPGGQGVRVRLVARLGGEGPNLLGVKVVIAESYERIHRSNLVGMGILPLQYKSGDTAASLGLTGEEVFAVEGWRTRSRRALPAGAS